MGAFDDVAPIIIPDTDPQKAEEFRKKWGWEPHEQVIIRGEYTAGHMRAVTNASLQSDLGGSKSSVTLQSGDGRIELMRTMIVDWTLSRNGQKVPISTQTIQQLPFRYMTPILEVCDRLASATLSEEEQADFLDSAHEPISENSAKAKVRLLKS